MTAEAKKRRIPRWVLRVDFIAAGLALGVIAVCIALRPVRAEADVLPASALWAVTIGRLAGVLALVIVTTQHVFSARLRLLDEAFGLDRLLRLHAVRGSAAVLLASVHPLLVCGRGLWTVGPLDAGDWPVLVGAGALVALWVIGITSRCGGFLQLSYEAWRRIHLLTFAVVAAATVHALWVAPAFWSVWPLVVWLVLLAGAAVLFVWARLVRPLRLAGRKWTVAAVEQVADNTVNIRLTPPEGLGFTHRPGQFALLTIYGSEVARQEHPFTIASAPGDPEGVSFTIRGSGDYTATLSNVRAGDRARVDGPYGLFSYMDRAPTGDLLLIAGGIGVTPMLSMLRALAAEGDGRGVTLIWANRTERDIPFREEVDGLTERLANFRVHHVLERQEDWAGETGRIDSLMLDRLLTDADRRATAFVCGPPGMMEAMVGALRQIGVPRRRVHTERFAL